MAKSMQQKREERKQKKLNNGENNGVNKIDINWFPGHMQKTKRLIEEKYDLIDIVYELVDSRIPKSSKIQDIDNLIKNKNKILIMTKCDLCDLYETKKWVSYYEGLGYNVLLFNSNNNLDYKKLYDLTNEVMKDNNIKKESKGLLANQIRVLVVGVPNVGKSTLINKMASRKACNVENKPGVTKVLSWIKTNTNILLLDTPGILWPKFDNEELALNLCSMTAVKESVINNDTVAIHILNKLNSNYKQILFDRFNIKELSDDIMKDYEIIAKKIGAYKNNEVDIDKVTNYIINEIKNEKIRGITFDRFTEV